MAAPEFVPLPAARPVRTYTSPPWRPDGWESVRPGEIVGRQPEGERLGTPAPDAGYALTLAERFADRLKLQEGEHLKDAYAGAAAVAAKRAGLFGRAPMIHDLTAAFTVWGFLDPKAPAELKKLRHHMFEECRTPHHYDKLRDIADAVPADVLAHSHDQIAEMYTTDWSSVVKPGH